jgi:hypothetical protein
MLAENQRLERELCQLQQAKESSHATMQGLVSWHDIAFCCDSLLQFRCLLGLFSMLTLHRLGVMGSLFVYLFKGENQRLERELCQLQQAKESSHATMQGLVSWHDIQPPGPFQHADAASTGSHGLSLCLSLQGLTGTPLVPHQYLNEPSC